MYACVVVHMSMDVCIVVHPKCMCGIHVVCMFTYKYLLAKKKKIANICHILHGFLIFFLFFGKSEGTRNIIALGTIPLAAIEKFTKTVSSHFCSFSVCISLFCVHVVVTLSRKLDLVLQPWSINISIISLCSYFSEARI
jgi:hypothetical protein